MQDFHSFEIILLIVLVIYANRGAHFSMTRDFSFSSFSENGVLDKTVLTVTSTYWSISTYAVSVWRNGPNWLVAVSPVLSTTWNALELCKKCAELSFFFKTLSANTLHKSALTVLECAESFQRIIMKGFCTETSKKICAFQRNSYIIFGKLFNPGLFKNLLG